MTVRPRSVGTFLISRPDTSAKLRARFRMRSMSSRERSSMESRLRFIRWLPQRGFQPRALMVLLDILSRLNGWASPILPGGLTDRHFVHPVHLVDAHVHALVAGGGKVLAHVVRADRQLAVAAVSQYGQLHAFGAAVVEEGVDGGAHGAAGVEHVVDEDDRDAVQREVDVRGEYHRLAVPGAHAGVVPGEGDVEVAERDRSTDQLLHALVQPCRDHRSSPVDPDDCDPLPARLLNDLVRDPHEGTANILAIEYDLLAAQTACSFLASRDRVKGLRCGA